MAAASVCVPRVSCNCLLRLWETLQDQQVGLPQATVKRLLLSQGASRAAPGKSGLHGRGEGERVMASQKCSELTAAAAAAKSLQSCLTLCDPMDVY